MKRVWFVTLAASLVFAQAVDESANARIRKEEAEHSHIMQTLHVLTDRYGPRVTGTPNYEAAAKWVVKQFTEWGFQNAHLEPWDFGRPGWLNQRADGHIVSPVQQNLKFEVLAWTASTNGTRTGSAIEIEPPAGPMAPASGDAGRGGGRGPQQRLGPTRAELTQWLEANKDKVRGKIVMVGKATSVPVSFDPMASRASDEDIRKQYDPKGPGRAGRGRASQDPNHLSTNQVNELLDPWLLANGALLRIDDAARPHGFIFVTQNRLYDPEKAVPTVVLRNEDYGRIERLLADGEDVRLEFNIVNHLYPEGKTSYNVVGEIPGSDKADEVVMLGGHLDSWHSGTGATDNAAGSAIMIEAARIIQALGLKPRRTIRVALWSGEEEGLLGSLAYVKQHFGTAEAPKPEFAKFDGYFNVDTGTGRLRGASIFGPPEAAALLRKALDPLSDLGVAGAMPSSSRATGGTDSTSFNNAGLPGIGFQQDTIEYNTVTHHSDLDTYERIIPEDVKSASVVVASAVWYVANLDQMLPRFTKEAMPAPVPVR
jgi:carboxypeptidase Q